MSPLAIAINNSIIGIDPNMSAEDFAKSVAEVVLQEYGSHNFEQFTNTFLESFGTSLADEMIREFKAPGSF